MNFGKIFISACFVTVMGFVMAIPVNAKEEKTCFCHNVNNNPVTVCSSERGQVNGHAKHVNNNGTDTKGACPMAPSVPEFGMIPGAIAAIGSAASYVILKRKMV